MGSRIIEGKPLGAYPTKIYSRLVRGVLQIAEEDFTALQAAARAEDSLKSILRDYLSQGFDSGPSACNASIQK
jgi:hypothetical protein